MRLDRVCFHAQSRHKENWHLVCHVPGVAHHLSLNLVHASSRQDFPRQGNPRSWTRRGGVVVVAVRDSRCASLRSRCQTASPTSNGWVKRLRQQIRYRESRRTAMKSYAVQCLVRNRIAFQSRTKRFHYSNRTTSAMKGSALRLTALDLSRIGNACLSRSTVDCHLGAGRVASHS